MFAPLAEGTEPQRKTSHAQISVDWGISGDSFLCPPSTFRLFRVTIHSQMGVSVPEVFWGPALLGCSWYKSWPVWACWCPLKKRNANSASPVRLWRVTKNVFGSQTRLLFCERWGHEIVATWVGDSCNVQPHSPGKPDMVPSRKHRVAPNSNWCLEKLNGPDYETTRPRCQPGPSIFHKTGSPILVRDSCS